MDLTAGPPWTAVTAAAAIKAGDVSVSELLEDILARLHATEPIVHAYAFVAEERARSEAASLDAELERGHRRGPLHGIPIAVKDVIAVAGLPLEAGSRAFGGQVADHDAAVVRSLRRAGGIVIGKTVTHELAYGQNTPPTRNARDASREPGGSSAGSAVATACGSALAALGTDGGGSVRHPAALNGVIGLKPTYGLLSCDGVLTVGPSLEHVGVLARTVADCALLLEALGGIPCRTDISVPGMRIGVLRTLTDPCGDEARAALEHAMTVFERMGAAVVDVDVPELELAVSVGLGLTLPEAASAYGARLREAPDLFEPGTRALLAAGELIAAVDYVRATRARHVVRNALRRAFETARLDAVACPSTPHAAGPAVRTEPPMEHLAGALRLHMWANVSGIPAITVPCGYSEDSLPLGLQLACPPFADARLLALAAAFERHRPRQTERSQPVASGDKCVSPEGAA